MQRRTVIQINRDSRLVFLALYLLLTLSACSLNNKEVVYAYYTSLDGSSWDRDEELFFSFDIENPNDSYSVYLDIRYTSTFLYQNIVLGIVKESPLREFNGVTKDIVVRGKVASKRSGGYHIYTTTELLEEGGVFPQQGVYTISVRHLMANKSIEGIEEVGIRIERNTK